MLCKICHGGARTVPARCPHGARYGARTVPAGKTRIIAQRAIELILVSIMLLILSRHVLEFPIFYSGHRAGTVRAPCGHRAGTERAPIGRSKGDGRREKSTKVRHASQKQKRNLKLKAEFRSCLTQSGAKPSFDLHVSYRQTPLEKVEVKGAICPSRRREKVRPSPELPCGHRAGTERAPSGHRLDAAKARDVERKVRKCDMHLKKKPQTES